MQKKFIILFTIILALLVIAPITFAEDTNTLKSCAGLGENFSTVYSDQYPVQCCEGLTEWESGFDTREIVNGKCVETGRLAGSPVGTCLNCGDGVCSSIENICNCEKDCSVPETTTVSETVKCLFNSYEQQTCNSEKGQCTTSLAVATGGGVTSCAVTVKGNVSEKITWKSSCGGYAYTILDGENEYAKFDCAQETQPCACTMEYAPVCAKIKECQTVCKDSSISSNTTTNCTQVCKEAYQTFGNKCAANCENAEILYTGECQSDTSNFCGGIAGISCKEGYECELDGDYPDAGGKCVISCPEYDPPLCAEGQKIVSVKDSRGCTQIKCVESTIIVTPTPQSDFYKGAYWKCSDGQEYKQYSEKCKPASEWKEYARKVCTGAPVECEAKCGVNTFIVTGKTCLVDSELKGFTGIKAICYDGKELNLGGESSCKTYSTWEEQAKQACANNCNRPIIQPTSTSTVNTVTPATSSTTSGGASPSTSVTTQGIQGVIKAYISGLFGATATVEPAQTVENQTTTTSSNIPTPVSTSTACNAQMEYVVDFELIDACEPNEQTKQCYAQTFDEISAIKEKCGEQGGGEVIVTLDDQKCNLYSCVNKAQISNECITVGEIPAEKKISCEKQGGQFILKTNDAGCLTFLDCVGVKDNNTSKINQELLTDKSTLLGIALKIESIKIELDGITDKFDALINYYSQKNDTNAKNKFSQAKLLLEKASLELDAVKITIRDNIDSFTEADAKAIREKIREIMDDTIKEVLLVMLE